MRLNVALGALLLLLPFLACARPASPPTSSPSSPSVLPLSLTDNRILSGAPIVSLDGIWTATSPGQNLTIPSTVPGDLISDLFRAKVIPEPLYERNWLVRPELWNNFTWAFTRSFALTAADLELLKSAESDVLLVFDGIKMATNISINSHPIGHTLSQFARYTFSLSAFLQQGGTLKVGDNLLNVTMDSAVITPLFMGCTGGWDWAPYSQTTTPDGKLSTFSRGIWKSVYLLPVPRFAVTHVVPQILFKGPFPITPLQNAAGFMINLTVHYYAPVYTELLLTIQPSWRTEPYFPMTQIANKGESSNTVFIYLGANDVDLWWPVGLGAQPLYTLTLNFTTQGVDPPVTFTAQRRIGFRFVAIVTGNDTDPGYVEKNADVDGSDRWGMMFRVNGAPMFVRGANVIPMDTMEGRYSAEAHRRLAISAVEGSMKSAVTRTHPPTPASSILSAFISPSSPPSVFSSVVRIWGEGVWLPDVFYDTCDELGLLIYHDLMNRGDVTRIPDEETAYRHSLRRLSHHPSIAVWDGCNECYAGFSGVGTVAMGTVVSEDNSRPVWPSCPAQGWNGGVSRLSALPNGEDLKPLAAERSRHSRVGVTANFAPFDLGHIEEHGPYWQGNGWPGKNGRPDVMTVSDPQLPIPLNQSMPNGLTHPSVFTSEYGAVGWSSFESVSALLDADHWSLHGNQAPNKCSWGFLGPNKCTGNNSLGERNYPADSEIIAYFGGTQADLDKAGEAAFKRQLWQAMMAQALEVKVYTEQHRALNAFGLQVWQLNEIWPTGGWGSVEWGTPGQWGQIVGGRWKPLHYWLRANLFTDRFISCGVSSSARKPRPVCFVKNDVHHAVEAAVIVSAVSLRNGSQVTLYDGEVAMGAGPGWQQWFDVSAMDGSEWLMEGWIRDTVSGEVLARNHWVGAPVHRLALQPVTVEVAVLGGGRGEAGEVDVEVRKVGTGVALWVTLTTRAAGRFSENAFVMSGDRAVVQFVPWGALDVKELTQSLRVECANSYA